MRAQNPAQTFVGHQESPHPLDRRLRNLAVVSVVAFIVGIAGYFGYAVYQVANRPIAGLSVPNDFSVMWAAAKLALEGRPLAAFDLEALTQARNLPPWTGEAGYRMSWLYPAHFHAMVVPFGLTEFMPAWIAFSVLGLAAFSLAVRLLIDNPSVTAITIASPAVLMCLIQGQITLIVGALLVGFLYCLKRGRSRGAGILLGLLTIKPQFGPLLPLILLVTWEWRTIAWAAAVSIGCALTSLIWVGPDYWLAFSEAIGETDEIIHTGWLPRHLMITWYAFGLGAGMEPASAKTLQAACSLGLAATVALVWRRDEFPFAVKAALLTFAIPLVTPYAYFYDLVLPVIGVGLLLADPRMRDPVTLSAAAAVWALPTLGHVLREAGVDTGFALIGAPVLTLAFGSVLWRASRQATSAPARI